MGRRTLLAVIAIAIAIVIVIVAVAGFVPPAGQKRPGNLPLPQSNFMQAIQITSPAFENNASMPTRFTCSGKNVSPPLAISGVPAGAKSLALILHDPDAPVSGGWTHWVKWNIPPETKIFDEGKEPAGVSGKGSGGKLFYEGPCPPSGTHRYFFKIYALDTTLDLPAGSSKNQLEQEMAGHVLGEGELVGLYAR